MALVITAPPYVAQLGFSAANGALLITVFAVTAACVKLVSGWLAEFVDRRLIMFAATIAMLASLLLLSSSTSYLAITTAYCLAGIAQGCILPASSALVATFFGAPSFGRIMGAMYIAVMLACVAAVLFVGGSFDQTGSYDTAFRAFAVASALIALAAMLIRSARDEPIEVRAA
jgi:MFS family permease